MLLAESLQKNFVVRGTTVTALDDVSVQLRAGRIVCVAGRSGAGKSTLLRCLLGLTQPDRGRVVLDGVELRKMSAAQRRSFSRSVAAVSQDPSASLPPRMRVATLVAEPLRIHEGKSADVEHRVAAALDRVELGPEVLQRFAHELSGGQQQRVAIARAVISAPRFLLADEPTSSLDAVTAMRIAQLLRRLVDDLALGLLVISHDPRLAWHLEADVLQMASGRVIGKHSPEQWLRLSRQRWSERLGTNP